MFSTLRFLRPSGPTEVTIAISSSLASLAVGQTSTITFTLNLASTTFATGDATVTGGTLGAITGSGTSYSAVFTPTVSSVANGVITVAAGVFTDAAGNNNTVQTCTITVDTIAPTISITASSASLTVGQTSTITFTLSEASTTFATGDATVTGGTLGAITGSGTSYSAVFTPTASSTTNGVITVAAGAFTDAAGNSSASGATRTITVNTMPPAAFTFAPTISANTANYNLKSAAIAAGWNQVLQLDATVTINSGIYVYSTSTGAYSFSTGTTFPAGSTLRLINNGIILGMGGAGGAPGYNDAFWVYGSTAGAVGGPAFIATNAISVTNNNTIGGGGGGGGGGMPGSYS